MKNLLTIFLLIIVQFAFGQSGSIQGKIISYHGDTVTFATVEIIKNDVLIFTTQTDISGNYSFNNLGAGIYNIETSYVGYATTRVKDIILSEYQEKQLNIRLYNECFMVEFFHKERLINPWNFTQSTTFSAKEIERMPIKNSANLNFKSKSCIL